MRNFVIFLVFVGLITSLTPSFAQKAEQPKFCDETVMIAEVAKALDRHNTTRIELADTYKATAKIIKEIVDIRSNPRSNPDQLRFAHERWSELALSAKKIGNAERNNDWARVALQLSMNHLAAHLVDRMPAARAELELLSIVDQKKDGLIQDRLTLAHMAFASEVDRLVALEKLSAK